MSFIDTRGLSISKVKTSTPHLDLKLLGKRVDLRTSWDRRVELMDLDKSVNVSVPGCVSQASGQSPWVAEWQTGGANGWTGCMGTLLQEDDSSISQALIKQSGVTISGPQPVQCPSCSDKVRQAIHQCGDRELDPRSPASKKRLNDQPLQECIEPLAPESQQGKEQRWLWSLSGGITHRD